MIATRTCMTAKWSLSLLFLLVQRSNMQRPDSDELIRTALANYDARQAQAKDYEYLERDTMTAFGNVRTVRRSTAYEIMVVDGRPYRRELHDGKPITPEEEEQERQKRAAEFRKNADEAITQPNMGQVIVTPGEVPRLTFKSLPYFFDVRWEKEEILDGRNAYVLEAKPKHGQRRSDEIEDDLRTFKMKIWIDEADKQIMRIKATAIHPGVLGYPGYVKVNPEYYPNPGHVEKALYDSPERYSQGTVITMDWRKINGEAWLPTRVHIKGAYLEPLYLTPLQKAGMLGDGSIEVPFEDETVFYDYQKFGVTHRILPPASH